MGKGRSRKKGKGQGPRRWWEPRRLLLWALTVAVVATLTLLLQLRASFFASELRVELHEGATLRGPVKAWERRLLQLEGSLLGPPEIAHAQLVATTPPVSTVGSSFGRQIAATLRLWSRSVLPGRAVTSGTKVIWSYRGGAEGGEFLEGCEGFDLQGRNPTPQLRLLCRTSDTRVMVGIPGETFVLRGWRVAPETGGFLLILEGRESTHVRIQGNTVQLLGETDVP